MQNEKLTKGMKLGQDYPKPVPFPIEVGQKVILFPVVNFNRYNTFMYEDGTITAIGRKYFEVETSIGRHRKITLDRFIDKDVGNDNAGYHVFESVEALENAVRHNMRDFIIRMAILHRRDAMTDDVVNAMYAAIPEDVRADLLHKIYDIET